jgi:hypothetical protein
LTSAGCCRKAAASELPSTPRCGSGRPARETSVGQRSSSVTRCGYTLPLYITGGMIGGPPPLESPAAAARSASVSSVAPAEGGVAVLKAANGDDGVGADGGLMITATRGECSQTLILHQVACSPTFCPWSDQRTISVES